MHYDLFVIFFFSREEENTPKHEEIVGTFFREFRVKPCQLKVNYHPVDVDIKALHGGSYIEVLNVFPLEDMELTLRTVEIQNVCGWGSAFSELNKSWLEDICGTQMYKFLADAVPFHTITTLGGGIFNLVLLPLNKSNSSLSRAYREGSIDFRDTVALEALNTTSKITKFIAEALNKAASLSSSSNINSYKNIIHLPPRPNATPRNIKDTTNHAMDSISRGLRTANYTILVVPRKEYQKKGASGAITSFVRALPIAVLAPLSGASEALSYTCMGLRNQIRPDVRREEEARQRGMEF